MNGMMLTITRQCNFLELDH